MSAVVARRVVISGNVQGVFFRDTMRRRAASRGVTGWARNRPDGTVQAHLEGAPDAVAEIVLWCRTGPRGAEVEDLEVSVVEPEAGDRFVVR